MRKLACVLVGLYSIAICSVAAAQGGDEECRTEWSRSSAVQSCGTSNIRKEGDMCQITVTCTGHKFYDNNRVDGTQSNQNFEHRKQEENQDSWFLTDVSKIVNCDGTLKVGPCNREGTGAASTECRARWAKSSAFNPFHYHIFPTADGKCRIEGYELLTATWPLEDVAKLVYCGWDNNNGELKVGGCNGGGLSLEACLSSWEESSASQSCHFRPHYTGDSEVRDDRCYFNVDCDGQHNTSTWSHADVSKLENCHGTLKVGSCDSEGTVEATSPLVDPACESSWKESPASKSCTAKTSPWKEGDICKIEARCPSGPNSTSWAIKYWNRADVSKLVHCNDKLKVGSCDRDGTGEVSPVSR